LNYSGLMRLLTRDLDYKEFLTVSVDVNGIFNEKIIRKKMVFKVSKGSCCSDLLSLVSEKLGLKGASAIRDHSIIILNGTKVNSLETLLSDRDNLSIYSPIAGG